MQLNLFVKPLCNPAIDFIQMTLRDSEKTDFEIIFSIAMELFVEYGRTEAEMNHLIDVIWKRQLFNSWQFIMEFAVENSRQQENSKKTLHILSIVQYLIKKVIAVEQSNDQTLDLFDSFFKFYPKLLKKLNSNNQAVTFAMQFIGFFPYLELNNKAYYADFLTELFEELERYWWSSGDYCLLSSVVNASMLLEQQIEIEEDVRNLMTVSMLDFNEARSAFLEQVSEKHSRPIDIIKGLYVPIFENYNIQTIFITAHR